MSWLGISLLLPAAVLVRATPIPPISPFTSSPYIPFNTASFERPPHDCLVLARVFHKYDVFGRAYPVIWDSAPFCAEGYGAPRATDARPAYVWMAKEKEDLPEGRHWKFVAFGELTVHEGDGWVARPGCVFESGKHGWCVLLSNQADSSLTESEWLPERSEVVNPYLEPEGVFFLYAALTTQAAHCTLSRATSNPLPAPIRPSNLASPASPFRTISHPHRLG